MSHALTQEQSLLQDSLQSWLQDHYSIARRQQGCQAPAGHVPAVWQALVAELGLGSLCLPEDQDGLGFDAGNYRVVMDNLGHSLVAEPVLESLIMGGELLARAGGELAQSLLLALAAGELCPVLAWIDGPQPVSAAATAQGWCLQGHKPMVMAAPWADGFIVAAHTAGTAISLFWVPATSAGLTCQSVPTIDGRRAADLWFSGVDVPAGALLGTLHGGQVLLDTVLTIATAALCAEGVGVVRKLLEDTVEYSKTRQQFGQPLARFQVLQHRMVDMFLAREMAAAATAQAASSINAAAASGVWSDAQLAVASAKLNVAEACRMVGEAAVQLHGGMGMTAELPVSHYFRRATVIARYLGTPDQMRRHIADLTRPCF
jgi:alkylation response protein AidB-like acyl-CoA dehydrogenase